MDFSNLDLTDVFFLVVMAVMAVSIINIIISEVKWHMSK
jgi:hypothetical protein